MRFYAATYTRKSRAGGGIAHASSELVRGGSTPSSPSNPINPINLLLYTIASEYI